MKSELLALLRGVYDKHCETLRQHLDNRPNLGAALVDLDEYHRLTGFVQDDLTTVETFPLFDSTRGLTFVAQYNPRRKDRFKRAWRQSPPGDIIAAHDGCPIVMENVWWQQHGLQIPYPKRFNNRPYYILVQPFKFGEGHCTIPSMLDEPQDWRPHLSTFHRRLLDLHAVTAMLGTHVILYNGVGAGASISVRFHVHILHKPGGLPIQQMTRKVGLPSECASVLRLPDTIWPLPAFRVSGPPEFVAGEVARLASHWQEVAGEQATESVAMYVEDAAVVCIYVPRDRKRELATSFGGPIGAYEAACGVFIFSEEDKGLALRGGNMSAGDLWGVLLEVRPEKAASL